MLAEIFFSTGPRAALQEMESFLQAANAAGSLCVDSPSRAAEHFYALLKGVRHMRVLVGLCLPPDAGERDAHVAEVVALFVRAYAPRAS